jgi:hypothetical protein
MIALPSRSTAIPNPRPLRWLVRRPKFDSRRIVPAIGPLVLALLCLRTSTTVADGGKLQLSQRQRNYQIAAFSAPTPLRVGPADVSVLLLDADSGSPIDDADVKVTATLLDQTAAVVAQSATVGAATNKLFRAANIELPTAGRWRFEVDIQGPQGSARTTFDTDVANQLPRALALWPWLAWPAIPIALYGLREMTSRRRSARTATTSGRRKETTLANAQFGNMYRS